MGIKEEEEEELFLYLWSSGHPLALQYAFFAERNPALRQEANQDRLQEDEPHGSTTNTGAFWHFPAPWTFVYMGEEIAVVHTEPNLQYLCIRK